MVAIWLLGHTIWALRGKPAWLPLLACLSILLIKRLPWLPGLSFLLLALGVACVLRFVRRHKIPCLPGTLQNPALAIVWFAWLVALLDWGGATHTSRQPALDLQRPVVCLGDSLTACGYPEVLARELTVPVVNLGVDGISTTDALDMLPRIRELRPQAIVIELGGHDFLHGHGEGTCERNLETIIYASREIGAEIVLAEIPRGIVIDRFVGLERRLARRHDLELISDTVLRSFVYFGPWALPGSWLPSDWHLSDDGLHPNARGNELLAGEVRDALARVFGGAIERTEKVVVRENTGIEGEI
jgi:lysophospholipase L1-like esterase